ncbi:unnamed protein product [marine sediment metagenome]|uniref:Uncharacterized protein n=1 Tax=marine sediment metagenome TaxID=412755 RepID=X1VWM9_9ZZZZ
MARKRSSKPIAGVSSASVERKPIYRREQEQMHTRVKRSEESWERWRARMKDRKRSM